jgi:Na+/proline symporter
MSILSHQTGLWILGLFGLFMFVLTVVVSRSKVWTSTSSGFLYAGRNVSSLMAAFGIAASWIWAPALFVSVQKSYELGLAGLFWFTVPNVVAVLIYTVLAPSIRKRVPGGFSIPDWIRYRFSTDTPALASLIHKLYLVPYIWYQVMAVTVQIFVGGLILRYLTGISLETGMLSLLGLTLAYSLISGLRASVFTDFVHMIMILLAIIIVIPMMIYAVGPHQIAAGLAGVSGSKNVLDPSIAFSFGIVTSIGLIAGSIADQVFWQRAFSIKGSHLVGAFALGGLLFAIVPVALSILGFAAAAPHSGVVPPVGVDLPLIGVAAVVAYLPKWVAVLFVLMLVSALTSALDSGLAAGASLFAADIEPKSAAQRAVISKQRIGEDLTDEDQSVVRGLDEKAVLGSRLAMLALAAAGYGVALFVRDVFPLDRLWWIFNGVASMFVVPTVLSIYWRKLSAYGVLVGLALSSVGMAFFVYGNYIQDNNIVIYSALFIVIASALSCALIRRRDRGWSGGKKPINS